MVQVEWLKGDKAVITVKWRRWFGLAPPKVVRYRGHGTVWHDAETGRRAPTHIELQLCAMWIKTLWDRAEKDGEAR